MPGKHAPASSRSFLVSIGTAIGGAIAALVVVVGIALVLLSGGSGSPSHPASTPAAGQTRAQRTHTSTPRASVGTSSTPTASGEASPTPNPGRTTLRILNGTKRRGLAANLASRAKNEGYPQAIVGSAPRAPKSTIYYRPNARADAVAFQQRFPELTDIAPAPSSFSTDVVLTVVIGADYPSAQDSASPSPSPSA